MKRLILIFLLFLPGALLAQEGFEFIDLHATEEHPGIATAPIVYRIVYYFEAVEDGLTVQAINNNGNIDSIIAEYNFNKGDKLALQFVTYSYRTESYPPEQNIYEDPFFVNVDSGVVSLVFPDYNYDRIKTITSFPVIVKSGKSYEFDLPIVKEEDIERIYYP